MNKFACPKCKNIQIFQGDIPCSAVYSNCKKQQKFSKSTTQKPLSNKIASENPIPKKNNLDNGKSSTPMSINPDLSFLSFAP